jgi:anti-anti-sigma regulatory factor
MAAAKKRVAEAKAVKAPRRKKVAAPVVVADALPPEADEKPQAVAKQGRTLRYLLPAHMEIAALGPVHQELVALEASNDGPFVLDGANLCVIDTAGLQLLISFVSAVQSSGKKVSWDNYSVQAYQLANELGVVDQLGD